ncbi:Saccharopepsin [Psilocybe cubensis]|uniref:Peptidase A1 domain-containing protein n=2 Tax=Psilocybe cubensis TaxID=181762 RepID=A0A8H7XTK9_PSICU|nr:Saccharopepsin [Psilocybe cubensis]KAH9480602.1 Saccharopepsin [Psilocybe cubensis]
MAWSFVVLLFFATALIDSAIQALHIPIQGTRASVSNFRRQAGSLRPGTLALVNSGDISYYAEIVLGNQSFRVLVDTGSSDLWVSGSVLKSIDTGKDAAIQYAANKVEGSIKQATLEFAGHVVPDQAFLEIPSNSVNKEGQGILGLGPGSSSFISDQIGLPGGAPALDRIFAQNRSSPNYFTILLGRSDPTDSFNGSITVSEVLEDYKAILNEPKLNITTVPANMIEDQHLQVLLDADGLIGPDGHPIRFESNVTQTENRKQATVVFDCGFTLPQVTRSIAEAIYGKFVGSKFTQLPGLGGVWVLPCEQEVNITFSFGGKLYPIHPLDMSFEPSVVNLTDFQTTSGERGCIGTFQPFTYDRGSNPTYDMVLGMAFMRNVYSLFDYGDFIQNSTLLETAYVQLHSLTDPAEAHADFVSVRLGGVDTTGDRVLKDDNDARKKSIYYVIAIVAVVAILTIAVVVYFWRRRRRGIR